MKVLVTGGCGFVGRRFVQRFQTPDNEVIVVDDMSTGEYEWDWHKPLKEGKVLFSGYDVREWFKGNIYPASYFDLIIHCAAVVGGRLKIEGDPLAVATDLAIDADFFNWCVKSKPLPRKVVYFSSSAVYPVIYQERHYHAKLREGMVYLHPEADLYMPDQTYGWAKLTGELLAKHAAKTYDLDVVCYRPFSGYGEDQALDYPFPSIIKRVVDGENPITIWGSGRQERDFIHIDDIVDGVIATMDNIQPGSALNLGTGRSTNFMELANIANEIIHPVNGDFTPLPPLDIKNDPTKPEGVFSRVADISMMKTMFTPKITLEEGVERSIKFLLDKKSTTK